jgi:hypothetical protein
VRVAQNGAVGKAEGTDDGMEDGLDEIEGMPEGTNDGTRVATTGFLEDIGATRVCVGVGAIVIPILIGHLPLIMIITIFIILPLPLSPEPLSLRFLEIAASPRTFVAVDIAERAATTTTKRAREQRHIWARRHCQKREGR